MERNIVHLGADPFPPYQFINERGTVEGSDFDLVSDLFHKKGFEVDCYIDDWGVVFEKFKNGKLDAVFQVQKTSEREAEFAFSSLLRQGASVIITSDPAIVLENFEDIKSKNLELGVSTGYSYGEKIDQLPEKIKFAYDTMEELISAVSNKEVDVGVIDRGVKKYLMEKMGISEIYEIPALTFLRDFYVMYHKNAKFDLK